MESKLKIDSLASRKVGNVGLILGECENLKEKKENVKLLGIERKILIIFIAHVALRVERYHTCCMEHSAYFKCKAISTIRGSQQSPCSTSIPILAPRFLSKPRTGIPEHFAPGRQYRKIGMKRTHDTGMANNPCLPISKFPYKTYPSPAFGYRYL